MLSRVGIRGVSLFARTAPRVGAIRSIATVKSTSESEIEILNAQRSNRPVSPHLTIYQPQLTMLLSGLHRITGVAMAGGFYALTVAFAATSILSIPFDGATLVSAFAGLPIYAKIGAKAAAAFPFAFHFANGIRHLIWDFGKELTIKGVYRTGYTVLTISAIAGTYLTFF
ncbi:hypothetical protein QA089_003060 [Meyerozyma guilliermondii]